jgi:hypothetical protein
MSNLASEEVEMYSQKEHYILKKNKEKLQCQLFLAFEGE